MKTYRWEVLIKGEKNKDVYQFVEISVIRSDNKHGHRSYGWHGKDKIILSDDQELTLREMRYWVVLAYLFQDSLNGNSSLKNPKGVLS